MAVQEPRRPLDGLPVAALLGGLLPSLAPPPPPPRAAARRPRPDSRRPFVDRPSAAPSPPRVGAAALSRIDEKGEAAMVDVSAKADTKRTAVADGRARRRRVHRARRRGGRRRQGRRLRRRAARGDPGREEDGRAHPAVPPLLLSHVGVELTADPAARAVHIVATASTTGGGVDGGGRASAASPCTTCARRRRKGSSSATSASSRRRGEERGVGAKIDRAPPAPAPPRQHTGRPGSRHVLRPRVPAELTNWLAPLPALPSRSVAQAPSPAQAAS